MCRARDVMTAQQVVMARRRNGAQLSAVPRRGETRSQLAEFFARLHKCAGLTKTLLADLVTLSSHFARVAQWQT
jgi:hypothetical protein